MKGACSNVQSIKDARKIKGTIVKCQLPCSIDNQEITAQIKNNFVVSNACTEDKCIQLHNIPYFGVLWIKLQCIKETVWSTGTSIKQL
jgi:hypothetical protein